MHTKLLILTLLITTTTYPAKHPHRQVHFDLKKTKSLNMNQQYQKQSQQHPIAKENTIRFSM